MTASNIWFIGNGGFYNRGCEAIFRTTADLISREFSGARFTAWSSDSEADARESKMKRSVARGPGERVALGARSPWRFCYSRRSARPSGRPSHSSFTRARLPGLCVVVGRR